MTSILKYEEKSINLINRFLNNEIDKRELLTMHHNLYYEIEEMHKQEMKKTWYDSTMQFDAYAEMTNKKLFDDYYEETFKKD